jgi:polyisoprenoid-binding protein YceI
MKCSKIIFAVALFTIPFCLCGQIFYSTEGQISFFSEAPLEDIRATHNSVTTTFDSDTGKIDFSLLIEDFEFRKSLMRTHFNENYLDSKEFPRAYFSGTIVDWTPGILDKDSTAEIFVKGDMTIRGVSNEMTITGKMRKSPSGISADAVFPIAVADFGIKVPKLLIKNIAEVVEVTVHIDYVPYEP